MANYSLLLSTLSLKYEQSLVRSNTSLQCPISGLLQLYYLVSNVSIIYVLEEITLGQHIIHPYHRVFGKSHDEIRPTKER